MDPPNHERILYGHAEPDGRLLEILKLLMEERNQSQATNRHQLVGVESADFFQPKPIVFQSPAYSQQGPSSASSSFMGVAPQGQSNDIAEESAERILAKQAHHYQLLTIQQKAAEAEAQRALLSTSTLVARPAIFSLPHPRYIVPHIDESLLLSNTSQAFQHGVATFTTPARERNGQAFGLREGTPHFMTKSSQEEFVIPEEHLVKLRFPEKLYYMLQKEKDNALIISFVGNGTAIKIHDPRLFETEILPRYFDGTRITSFQRQLNLYGFRRIDMGPCRGAYFHKYFIQGQDKDLYKIVRDYRGRSRRNGGGSSSGALAKSSKACSSPPPGAASSLVEEEGKKAAAANITASSGCLLREQSGRVDS